MVRVVNNTQISNVSFGRAPKEFEKPELKITCAQAVDYLGVKPVLIMHSPSFPVCEDDLFIGSHVSEKAAEVNDFFSMYGFKGVQLGPVGLLGHGNNSPYLSSVCSKNYLFANMKKLTGDDYANILDISDIKKQSSKLYENNADMVNYEKAFDAYDRLFERAYDNLKIKTTDAAINLKMDFENFKKKSGKWLETDSLYQVLSKKFGNKFEDWTDDTAKNLISYLDDVNHPKHQEALDYLRDLNSQNSKEIDLYKFQQFITDRHEREFTQNGKKLEYMSDALIGFSDRDVWANQDCFLKDFRVGCPYGGQGLPLGNGTPVGANQLWDISVIDPKTLFKEDGSLNKGGLLLRQKFSSLLDCYQNLRIDHVFGLVNPWIYNKHNVEVVKNEKGEVVHTNAYGAVLSKFGKEHAFEVNGWDDEETKSVYGKLKQVVEHSANLDPKLDYLNVLEKIVLPVINEKGLSKNDPVWENLGADPDYFKEIYYQKLKLPGITDIKGQRVENQPQENWFLISSHDDPVFSQVASDKYFEDTKAWGMNPDYLADRLYGEKSGVEKDIFKGRLFWDRRDRVIAKYQELFTCSGKIQMFFADFFGLADKVPYNKKGVADKNNWKLRLTNNFQNDYYNLLVKKGQGESVPRVALNMPEIYKRAVISKAVRNKEYDKMKPLIEKLEKFERILYEPEMIFGLITKGAKEGLKVIA